MAHTQTIHCSKCSSSNIHKNGIRPTGIQYWRCKDCRHNFQLDYIYNARKAGIKEKIIEMTLNSSGVRDISRVLKINKRTVISELRKKNDKTESLFSI